MIKLLADFKFTTAIISLILMNLIPLIGVFWFGWDTATIIFLYWLENVIIGVLNIPKIFACRGVPQNRPNKRIKGAIQTMSWEHRERPPKSRLIFLCVFFSFHYGMFCFGHYIFLKSTYKSLPGFNDFLPTLFSPLLFWSILGLTVSHVISMLVNFYGKREYEARTPNKQMFVPYSRIVLLHIVIILSGFVALATGQGLAVLVLLVLLKIGFDLAAHIVEHSKAGNSAALSGN